MKSNIISYFSTSLLLASSCMSCRESVSLTEINRQVLSFQELPDTVVMLFTNKSEMNSNSGEIRYPVGRISYRLTVKEMGPFTDHFEITDSNNEFELEISYDKPLPFVIYKSTLYIADRYNVYNKQAAVNARFEKYPLP
jgi:hypothetical protein